LPSIVITLLLSLVVAMVVLVGWGLCMQGKISKPVRNRGVGTDVFIFFVDDDAEGKTPHRRVPARHVMADPDCGDDDGSDGRGGDGEADDVAMY